MIALSVYRGQIFRSSDFRPFPRDFSPLFTHNLFADSGPDLAGATTTVGQRKNHPAMAQNFRCSEQRSTPMRQPCVAKKFFYTQKPTAQPLRYYTTSRGQRFHSLAGLEQTPGTVDTPRSARAACQKSKLGTTDRKSVV